MDHVRVSRSPKNHIQKINHDKLLPVYYRKLLLENKPRPVCFAAGGSAEDVMSILSNVIDRFYVEHYVLHKVAEQVFIVTSIHIESGEQNFSYECYDIPHCPICERGSLIDDYSAICLDRPGQVKHEAFQPITNLFPKVLVYIDLPCKKCDYCGEVYISSEVYSKIQFEIDVADEQNVEYSIRKWVFSEK